MGVSREPGEQQPKIGLIVVLSLAVALPAAWWANAMPTKSSAQQLPPPVTGELLPPGPLPGKQVRGRFGGAGLGHAPDVREIAFTGRGSRRTSLLIARGKRDQLCSAVTVGARARSASFRCLRRWDHPPMLLRVGIGGKARDLTDWFAMIGLVRREVSKVTFESQHFSIRQIPLQGPATFPWRAFAVMSTQRGNLPVSIRAHDGSGLTIQQFDLGWTYGSPCPDRHSLVVPVGEKKERKCRGRRRLRRWSDVRDPLVSAQARQLNGRIGDRSKALAVDHPTVRSLVAGQPFSIGTLILWSKCDKGRIGAIVQIRLTKPVSFEGDVPIRGFRRGSHSAYVEGIAHVKVQGLVQLWVAVDLNRRAVVGIEFYPADFGDASEHPGPQPTIETRIVTPLKPAGGRDTGDCGPSRD